MKYYTIAQIYAGESEWVGTITDQHGRELFRSEYRPTALHAFIVCSAFLMKLKGKQ